MKVSGRTFGWRGAGAALLAFALVPAAQPDSRDRAETALAPTLPEVHQCLDAGHTCLRRGDFLGARQQADLVLIGDPITVAVRFDPDLDARERRDGEDAVQEGLDAWAEALNDEVAFRRDDNATTPTVTIIFQRDVERGGENLGGWIGWTRHPSGYAATIRVRTRRTDGRRMPAETLIHAVTHEMGHVLGLADVPECGPLMGQIDPNRPAPEIGPAEVRAVQSLRRRAQALRAAARS